MHALTFGGKEIIHHSDVSDPRLIHPSDAIVKITMASICGSDLHVYHDRETGQDHGTVMGHEFTGIIEEAGSDVKKFKKGARVLSPFTTSCGECFYCRIGLTCRCEKGNLFGWVEKGHGLQGAQAGYIRVPMADSTLLPLSNDLNEKKGLLLGDIFSTGEAYDKNLIYKSGRSPARYYAEKLLQEEVPQRYAIEDIITHQFSLPEGATAYEVFDKKLDGCIKAVLVT